jgi:ureidoacrylate peracid hydrolase
VSPAAKPMLTAFAQKVSPHNAAVLVVDVQNDYCAPGGGLAKLGVDMSAIEACVPRVAALVEGAREVGVPVIHIRTHHEAATESPAWRELRQRRSPNKPRWCEPGTWGADFYHVAPQSGEVVITKHRYSGFIETDLDLILRSQGIVSLIMAGVASNNCVECTARDGFMKDYYIVFVDDCTAATNKAIHAATLANMESLFGIVVQSEQVLAEWQALKSRERATGQSEDRSREKVAASG